MRIILEYTIILVLVAGVVALVPQLIAIVSDSWFAASKHIKETIDRNNKDLD